MYVAPKLLDAFCPALAVTAWRATNSDQHLERNCDRITFNVCFETANGVPGSRASFFCLVGGVYRNSCFRRFRPHVLPPLFVRDAGSYTVSAFSRCGDDWLDRFVCGSNLPHHFESDSYTQNSGDIRCKLCPTCCSDEELRQPWPQQDAKCGRIPSSFPAS